jgi:hypothetical protein
MSTSSRGHMCAEETRGRPVFFGPQNTRTSEPLRSAVGTFELEVLEGTAVGARERALSVAQRAHLAAIVRAALIGERSSYGDEEMGAGTLQRLPWLAGVPVDIVAREGARVHMPHLDLRLSVCWQERLEVAARQIERHSLAAAGQPGLAAATILDLVRGGWRDELRDGRSVRPPRPRSLGAIAVCVRRLARQWRRHARARQRQVMARA